MVASAISHCSICTLEIMTLVHHLHVCCLTVMEQMTTQSMSSSVINSLWISKKQQLRVSLAWFGSGKSLFTNKTELKLVKQKLGLLPKQN